MVDREADIGVKKLDAPVPGQLAGAEPPVVRTAGLGDHVLGVAVRDRLFVTELGEPHTAVLTDRVQHPVGPVLLRDDRLVAQRGKGLPDLTG